MKFLTVCNINLMWYSVNQRFEIFKAFVVIEKKLVKIISRPF